MSSEKTLAIVIRVVEFSETKSDRPVLTEALACPGPSIVDVPVDYRENPKLTERLGHLVCPI